jgi:hypothetical protein
MFQITWFVFRGINGATLISKVAGEILVFITAAALTRALPTAMPPGTMSSILRDVDGIVPTPPPLTTVAVTSKGPL